MSKGLKDASAQERKAKPIVRGCLDYFPDALLCVAEVSRIGNEQHNPGQEMHHARGKSTDHADCLVRHLMGRGTLDSDGMPHMAKVAWRALALLQEELEAGGAPLARGARLPEPVKEKATSISLDPEERVLQEQGAKEQRQGPPDRRRVRDNVARNLRAGLGDRKALGGGRRKGDRPWTELPIT